MTSFRDKVNTHLPVVLQVLSTASLVVIALSALCGSQSLKRLAGSHQLKGGHNMHRGHMMHRHMNKKPQQPITK